MAVSAYLYGKALANILGGETAGESSAVDYLSDTIKVALCTSTYVPAQDTHEFFSDVTNELGAGSGYTAGGATLASKTVTYTAGTNTTTLDAADTTWAASTLTARIAPVYKDTGVAGTSVLLGYVDFGADNSSNNGNFTIAWNASGLFTFSAA